MELPRKFQTVEALNVLGHYFSPHHEGEFSKEVSSPERNPNIEVSIHESCKETSWPGTQLFLTDI